MTAFVALRRIAAILMYFFLAAIAETAAPIFPVTHLMPLTKVAASPSPESALVSERSSEVRSPTAVWVGGVVSTVGGCACCVKETREFEIWIMLFLGNTDSVLALVLPTSPLILMTKWRNQVEPKQFLTKGVEFDLTNLRRVLR